MNLGLLGHLLGGAFGATMVDSFCWGFLGPAGVASWWGVGRLSAPLGKALLQPVRSKPSCYARLALKERGRYVQHCGNSRHGSG